MHKNRKMGLLQFLPARVKEEKSTILDLRNENGPDHAEIIRRTVIKLKCYRLTGEVVIKNPIHVDRRTRTHKLEVEIARFEIESPRSRSRRKDLMLRLHGVYSTYAGRTLSQYSVKFCLPLIAFHCNYHKLKL